MLRIFSLILILLPYSVLAEEEVVIFIGEVISASRSENSCQDYLPKAKNGTLEEICMDRVFHFKYQVKELIQGEHKEKEIDFTGFYHYWGFPPYTTQKDSLVILKQSQFGYMLQSVEWVTKENGEWAYCKEWPDESEDCKVYKPITVLVETFNKARNPTATPPVR